MKGLVVKGSRAEKPRNVFFPNADDGTRPWARTPCQKLVDVKALTGRGGTRLLREAQAEIDRVRREMAVLVELTHRVAGRTMYLCLHKRPGRVTLRWRNTGASAPHLPWAAAAERIAQFERSDPRLAAWYREADRQARLLNLEEKTAGATLRRARAALGLGQLTID